ncbi:hotdog domain-containing protein [Nocardioides campestrisoli]|uniref:hotdog domain-containing protein n=1 Tax=Nocardioides campestrisoli TaxID=2736757 RepID=UPI00163DACCE|nr:hotdog domain-containing protein [Nocardioides campestrisoli]
MSEPTTSRLDEHSTVRAALAGATRALQDLIRGTSINDDQASQLLGTLSGVLEELAAAGSDDGLGRVALDPGPIGCSQALSPVYEVTHRGAHEVRGDLTFSRFHLGSGGAAHGGSIALWADDVLGRLAHVTAGGLTRTAYLHVDYQALVPVGHRVTFVARVDNVEGRKLSLSADVLVDGEVATRAHGLWIQAR